MSFGINRSGSEERKRIQSIRCENSLGSGHLLGRYLLTKVLFVVQVCQPQKQKTLCLDSQWGSGWHINDNKWRQRYLLCRWCNFSRNFSRTTMEWFSSLWKQTTKRDWHYTVYHVTAMLWNHMKHRLLLSKMRSLLWRNKLPRQQESRWLLLLIYGKQFIIIAGKWSEG